MQTQTRQPLEGFQCRDCGRCTHVLGEYYMVHDTVWQSAGMSSWGGMLCVDCLEKRLGRELESKDFPDYPINYMHADMSGRLLDRIGVRHTRKQRLEDFAREWSDTPDKLAKWRTGVHRKPV